MKNVLFICGKARMRSPTAADVVGEWPGYSTDFAGISRDADEMISSEQVEWADMIFVMDRRQKKRLSEKFGHLIKDTKVIILGIPDQFDYMAPDLVDLIVVKLRPILDVQD
ncbi:low molecular weight protein tyrosine phosphatase family protein [Ruegeria arenilitoris]|uniref:low molecular weight protein tyrosine phosphatase family protein n=1 Tax=Ruegeria arenilitoris TaxID=1173585 RepID=UPI0020C4B20A|nr:phosphotyrosine protein phosphatase [Ruegeria arenilitoris]